MKLKVHGCRGSVPVNSDKQRKYGGNTSCFEITFGTYQIFFDTGTGFRTAKFGGPEIIKIILYSHWHHDHIQGLPFNPNIFDPNEEILVSSALSPSHVSRQILRQYFSGSFFPVDFIDGLDNFRIHEFDYIKERFKHDFKLEHVPLRHPGGATGYRIKIKDKIVCYLCDNEFDTLQISELKNFVEGANVVIWDGMFTDAELLEKKGWGHSSISQGVFLRKKHSVEKLLITHHTPDRTDEELDHINAQLPEGVELAYDGMICEI